MLAAAALADRPARRRIGAGRRLLWIGVPLALTGYPLGCAMLGHRPPGRPSAGAGAEILALAAVVAPAEELTWGVQVERRLGVLPTAVLFAGKHVAIDGRWRRGLGLALFWVGLGLVRRRSPALALGLHIAANAGGVMLGHATGTDRF
ncbi:MAG TPA: hypothetical protein VGG31_09835 [Candidatus Dormibacteraeota bacterium]